MEVRDHDIECEECGRNTDLTTCIYCGRTLCVNCGEDHADFCEDCYESAKEDII